MLYTNLIQTDDISYSVVKSARKTLSISVRDGKVTVRVPKYLSEAEIHQFVEKHKKWIVKKLTEYEKKEQEIKNLMIPSFSELTRSQLEQIKLEFETKTKEFAKRMCVSYGRITIRNQKTRWGSCSSKGNLNFNYRLFFLPEKLRDYVIVHELAHRKYMNHSKEFWAEVEKYMPDYEVCRNALKQVSI